ncbi:hypothetical protein GALMADRAFT_234368 [Galerina marginata CBS 339.88]|uniref:WD repeat-containing protein 75 second beta-propeller domain-containing protein n=1 Tax=Galerina marginata (strain CBS 339.88) TaxID=685588 RepID=A0A067TT61_GALM3|nr:hypothetical protein GALMADRAFT_234368 [Galerina marginata CBS 339.88]
MAASTSKRPKSDTQNPKETQKPPSNKGKGKENSSKATSTPNSDESWPRYSLDDDTPWNWISLTDPSSSRIPPIFTNDGSYFLSLVGSAVKIYSTATGLVVSTLTAPPSANTNSHTDVLTSVVINPQNAFQLITASLDGRLMIWDFVNATLLQTINVGQPILCMCVHEQFKGFVYVAASRPRKKAVANDNNAVVLQVSLKHLDRMSQAVEIVPVGKTRSPTGLAISPNGAWLVATAGHKVYVAKTASLSSGFTKYVSPERLTCLAFHPFEEYFATGDEKGVIRLWYCLNDNLAVNVRGVEKRTQTRSFHWHAHAVSSVTFTPNGAYLLSGGEESVLVIWQLHTGKKEFVPRLGAPVSTLSMSRTNNSEQEYLVGLADATYTFVSSASLKVTRSYSRIKIDPATQGSASSSKQNIAPIAMQYLTSTLILPSSHPSSLQTYSLLTSSLISEVEISPSNRVSRRDDKPIVPSTVEKVVVSESGYWMATVDIREGDTGFRPEVYLKMWSWDRKQENWVLNTRIDRPHGTCKVTDVEFSPNPLGGKCAYLVTTGMDGRIKLWKLSSQQTIQEGSDSWVLHATLNFRSEIPGCVSWSPDGSLFAVAVGPYIAIYTPASRSLLQTLTAPENRNIRFVHFIGADGRYLLATGANTLVMWDLIRSRVSWQSITPLPIDLVISHKKEETFAVFHSTSVTGEERRTKVSIFSVLSNVPNTIRALPFGLRNAILVPVQHKAGYNIAGVTDSWRVVMISDSSLTLKDEGLTARAMNFGAQAPKRTLFQDIFGASAFATDPIESTQTSPLQGKEQGGHETFNDSAYLSPSLDQLFASLAKTFLTARPSEKSTTLENQEDFIDEDTAMNLELDFPANHVARLPQPGEMNTFTKLFRTHCMIDTPPSISSKAQPKLNGVHQKETNGSLHRLEESLVTKPARTSNNQPNHATPLDHSPPLPSTLMNGKKRKKVSS